MKLIKTIRFKDHRGFFSETYNKKDMLMNGIDIDFVQDNFSLSLQAGTVRGMHFQTPPYAQAKLVRCTSGAIYDVGIDIRIGSPSYGMWKGFELSAENGHQLYIPIGFAHGFLTLRSDTEVQYKCSNYYSSEHEGSIRWNSLDIDWPFSGDVILSDKDSDAPSISDFKSPFIYRENS